MARPAVAVRAGDARVPPNRDADRSDADETMRADAARYDGIGETFVQ